MPPRGPVFLTSSRYDFWGYEYEINEWIQNLVSAMSPFSNANPIFAVNAVNSSQDFWFYFTKQVSFWMRDDSLWANGAKAAKVWLFEGPFGGISCSWNLLFPCARSLWFTVACRWIPSSPFKTSMLWTGPAPDFRSRSCFCLNSYRSCDTCLIVKTLPFAECTVSDYIS